MTVSLFFCQTPTVAARTVEVSIQVATPTGQLTRTILHSGVLTSSRTIPAGARPMEVFGSAYATGYTTCKPLLSRLSLTCLVGGRRQYATMRDALNATGRPMWYSITQILDYNDGRDAMHCSQPKTGCSSTPAGCKRWSAFTVRPWVYQGLEPQSLANSYLVECAINNATLSSPCAALNSVSC